MIQYVACIIMRVGGQQSYSVAKVKSGDGMYSLRIFSFLPWRVLVILLRIKAVFRQIEIKMRDENKERESDCECQLHWVGGVKRSVRTFANVAFSRRWLDN